MAARPRKIVVGYDGSAPAQRALEAAADLVGYGSTLAVVSVRPGNGSTGTAAVALDDARDRLVRRQLSATYLDPVGEPVEQLLEATRRLGGDLIVVGSRRGVMRRRLLEAALCDVLVVA